MNLTLPQPIQRLADQLAEVSVWCCGNVAPDGLAEAPAGQQDGEERRLCRRQGADIHVEDRPGDQHGLRLVEIDGRRR